MPVGWIYHEAFLRHDAGPGHPESPRRLRVIVQELERQGLRARLHPLSFEPTTPAALAAIHDPAYVDLVAAACAEGLPHIGGIETGICPASYDIALLAAGGVLAACDAVMAGQVHSAFCAVRPPGHHAERDLAKGFCLFNHVALAAAHLLQHHGLQRVAVVDLDVHHGNGVQHAFEDRADVLYVSLHEHPHYRFPHTGFAYERGQGPGEGYTLNIPFPPGTGDDDYRRAFTEQVRPALERFAPQFVLVSLGFDALWTDPLGGLCLKPPSFHWLTRELLAAAQPTAAGRLVSVLEGGYDLDNLGAAAACHVRALLGEALSA